MSTHHHEHHHAHDHGHGHGHGHDHHHHAPSSLPALLAAIGMTSVIFFAEFIAGILSGSLSLLADSAHMLSDAAGLIISLIALLIGKRKTDMRATYGYRRAEVMAAAFNALFVGVVSLWIVWEAISRLKGHEYIHTDMMISVAIIGLIANAVSAFLLMRKQEESLNIKAAYLHVLSDLLGSVAVIIAGVIIAFTGFYFVDTLASLIIAALILPRSYKLLAQSLRVLMEWAPKNISHEKVTQTLMDIDGVETVHDLHIWSVNGKNALATAHVVVDDPQKNCTILCEANHRLKDLGIDHSTIQIESKEHQSMEEAICHD